MEFNERRVLELFLGLIFVTILIGLVIIAIYLPAYGKNVSSTSKVISNSYNNYNTNNYEVNNYNTNLKNRNIVRTLDEKYFESKEKEFLDYSSYGEHEREETIFNNYRDEFRVYVVNKDYESGYFKVKFYFCDYYNECFSNIIEKYISAGEERVFQYIDTHEGKYAYYEWKYKVFPEELK